MEMQAAFNLAYLGVIAQGKPSIVHIEHEGSKCLFNHIDDADTLNHCAIGWITEIKSEDIRLEDIGRKLGLNTSFLLQLQSAHDNAAVDADQTQFIPEFKRRMLDVAANNQLEVPLLNEADAKRNLEEMGYTIEKLEIHVGPNQVLNPTAKYLIDFLQNNYGYEVIQVLTTFS